MKLCMNMVTILIFVGVFVSGGFTLKSDFIELQASKCPYISLCTRPNTTYFDAIRRPGVYIPCCRDCSCDDDCIALGNCCPDYSHVQDFNESLANNTAELAQPRNELAIAHGTNSDLGCVRTHYGFFNDDGYRMLDTCPQNYPENTTKTLCETQFDYMMADIYDHVPVSSKLTGISSKNQFCRLCQAGVEEPFEFLEVWFVCKGNVVFNIANLTSPQALVRRSFQTKPCSLVFKPSNEYRVLNATETCKKEEIITTCGDNYLNTDAEKACKEYTWPIIVKNGFQLQTYKNYAYMICNGLQFQEYRFCMDVDHRMVRHFSATLNIEVPMLDISKTWNKKKTEHDTSFSLLRRDFPANLLCREGLVFDDQTNACRQILCPYLFFARNGKCEPVFIVMENVVYNMVLDILLPYSLNNAPVHVMQTALFSSLDSVFADRLDSSKEHYQLSLWTNSRSADRINQDVKYVVLLCVSWKFAGGNYFAFLEFVHRLLHVERQVSITVSMVSLEAKVNVGLRLSSSVEIFKYKPYSMKFLKTVDPINVEDLHVVEQTSEMKSLDIATISHFIVTKISLCYTVRLSGDEVRQHTRNRTAIEIVTTKQILLNKNVLIDRTSGKEKSYFVCLNDALSNIGERSSYVMNATDSMVSLFEWPREKEVKLRPGSGESPAVIGVERSGDTDHTKSFVAIISSIGLVVFLVSIKVGLKKLCNSSQTVDDNADDVGNQTNAVGVVENIPMATFGPGIEND